MGASCGIEAMMSQTGETLEIVEYWSCAEGNQKRNMSGGGLFSWDLPFTAASLLVHVSTFFDSNSLAWTAV